MYSSWWCWPEIYPKCGYLTRNPLFFFFIILPLLCNIANICNIVKTEKSISARFSSLFPPFASLKEVLKGLSRCSFISPEVSPYFVYIVLLAWYAPLSCFTSLCCNFLEHSHDSLCTQLLEALIDFFHSPTFLLWSMKSWG